MPRQRLARLVFGKNPIVRAELPVREDQITPDAIDLRLGKHLFGMRSAALPKDGESVGELIAAHKRGNYGFALTDEPKLLEKGTTYLIELEESVDFPPGIEGRCSAKSSIGRCGVFARVLVDGRPFFDRIPSGHSGRLYIEVTPLICGIYVTRGLSLTQMRVVETGVPGRLTGAEIIAAHAEHALVYDERGKPIGNGALKVEDDSLYFGVDLDRTVVGFEAKASALYDLDLTSVGTHPAEHFFTPITREKDRTLVLMPGKFYLLATTERISIPPHLCGELEPFVERVGEFRTHYAGFFGPGFGYGGGTVGVLEVRASDVPFRLVHGQPVCRMAFDRMSEPPDTAYEGSYRGANPSLPKFLIGAATAWH